MAYTWEEGLGGKKESLEFWDQFSLIVFLKPLFKVEFCIAEYARVLLVLPGAANIQDTEKIRSSLTVNKYVEVWYFKLSASHIISMSKFISLIPSGYKSLFVTVERCA